MRRRLLALFSVLVLVPMLLVSMGPGLVRAIVGAAPHVCRCDAAHTDCTCTICHPELEDHSTKPAAKGACGERDVGYVAAHPSGVLPPEVIALAPPALANDLTSATVDLHDRRSPPPEPPPPRS